MKYLKAVISLSKPNIILSVGLTGFTGIVIAHSGVPSLQITLLSLLCLIFSAAGSAMVNNLIFINKIIHEKFFFAKIA